MKQVDKQVAIMVVHRSQHILNKHAIIKTIAKYVRQKYKYR